MPSPPVASREAEYASPTSPDGRAVVTTWGATSSSSTSSWKARETVWPPLDTARVTDELPVWVGVPDSTPASESSMPAGSVPLCRLHSNVPAPAPPEAARATS